jgi:hypothetical protein
MQAQQDYPRVTAVLDLVADWYKRRQRHSSGLEGLPESEVDKIAKDMGVSSADLRALDRLADQPLLLGRMLEQLHLDAETLSRTEPEIFRDLQRVCALCDVKKRCERDLDAGTGADHFEEYCPNSLTLKAVS